MPISKVLPTIGLVMFALLQGGAVFAFDPDKVFADDGEPRTVLRYGYNALQGGRVDDAVGAFTYGAEHKHVASEWKLARMYQQGEGVARDDLAAYDMYRDIAGRFLDTSPTRFEMPFVASSIVMLGTYAMDGLKGRVIADPRLAESYYYRAAALYHDAEAQYRLGKLYFSGAMGAVQKRGAVRWFGLAAKKGHSGAQAELGRMLFAGDGVRRRPVRGLVYLGRAARRSPNPDVLKWRDEAFAQAAPEERESADAIIAELPTADLTYGLAVDALKPATR